MKFWIIFFIIPFAAPSFAQVPYNTAAPNGYSKKASVSEQVGLTQVSITYHRPAVKGRDGKIWGQVVHKGFVDQGFGNRKPAPWRAGANENTIFEIDKDVKVEGLALPKGKYGLFIAYDSLECTIIFSRRSDGWGSFFYDPQDDALRVKVKPQQAANSVENLKYEFTAQTINSAVIGLYWERVVIPFKLEVDHLKQQFEAFAAEAQQPGGFTTQGLNIAANWALQNNYRLDKALEWATMATGSAFPGNPSSFSAQLTRAGILEKLGKPDEAAAVVKTALPFGTITELQQYGRQLINAKKVKEALEVSRFNYTKHGDQFITLTGMARALSSNGEYAKALEYLTKALSVAPNDQSKQVVQKMVETLKAQKDIN